MAVSADTERGDGPTVYAQLMEFTLAEPRRVIFSQVEALIRGQTEDLAENLIEQLRKAYVAGVTDGYREAITTGKIPEVLSKVKPS